MSKRTDKKVFHVVVATNRLSGVREAICTPCCYDNAVIVYKKFLQSKRPRPYLYPKIVMFDNKLF